MAAEIISISTQDLTTQIYTGPDINLISIFDITASLSSNSYIEYFTYDLNQNILSTDYNHSQYTVINDGQSAGLDNALSNINIDPEQSLSTNGFDQGSYIAYYNFLNKQIGSNIEQLYITEISSDRTEVRLDSMVLSNLDIVEKTNTFIQERDNSIYFLDFYLNFGDNQLLISNNISLDNLDPNNPTILVKLYEPLPNDFDLNSTLWIVTSIEEPVAYQVNFEDEVIIVQDTTPIKGPNFNLDLKDQVNNSSLELSYADLIITSLTSSQNQLNSLLEEKEIDINIDYTNFNNFIHFSSAQTRIKNFYYKVNLIEQYSSSIAILNSTNSSSIAIGETSTVLENKINDIITNFDGYDYYLYYNSGSYAWPKTTSEPPYQLATSTDPITLTWFGSTNEYSPYFGGIINSASLFDNENKDNLLFSIPEFLRDDPDNSQYELFIDMIAQHFDNIWIYYKDVTQKFNADNRLESGISKDIVSDAIRDFGIKLYQNNFSNEDLFTAFLGLTPEGGLFPFPNITGSLPTPSGYEYIDTLISASNDYLPLDDVNKSLYKRIYHNLPYLLKSKGTLPGLRALITSYGIPDTILRINEYGGKDKVEGNDWDYWQNEFNYAFKTEGNNFISSSWNSINTDWDSPNNTPSTLAFRFKTEGLSSTNIPYSQSLWRKGDDVHLVLRYTGSGYTSGSYSGSISDPYNQYALLDFYPNYTTSPNESSSLYLPFFNGDWWSVMINREGITPNFTLSAANKIYNNGDNGTLIGFYSTSSITASTDTDWYSSESSYFTTSSIINGLIYNPFSGSIQEIRYYNTVLNKNSFKDFTMNPYSIEGNSLNNGPNELIFRASLGGELYTESLSIHPKITGSWITTSSFTSDSDFYFNSTPVFVPNTEYFFYDQPIVGIRNAVSDKIRLEDNVMPSGDTLSAYRRITQNTEVSASYTPSTNLLEVAFSPQDEINDDISSQIGYFNIGDFIGDPAFRSSQLTSYSDLDVLRNSYFEKYTKNYNLFDYIRIIKFFDNSLFKMIKDFVPARTSLASGIVIKQHLLERNRYPQPQMSYNNLDISGTLKPQWNNYEPGTIENFEGGAAGVFNIFNGAETSPYGIDGNGPINKFNITQSWYETYPTLSGSITILHDSQDEFFNGEFSGSTILITTQSLNKAYPLNLSEFEYTPVLYSNQLYGSANTSALAENQFLNPETIPFPGEILILAPKSAMFSPIVKSLGNAYVKIHKLDCNGFDNNIPLGQITHILIKYTTSPIYKSYEILNINEYPTYFLYQISNQNITTTGIGVDNYIEDYCFSGSKIVSETLISNTKNILKVTSSIDTQNIYTSTSGKFQYNNTPNIKLDYTASFIAQSATISSNVYILFGDNVVTQSVASASPTTFTVTGSIYPLPSNQYYINFNTTGRNITLTNTQFSITQSTSPTSSVCDSVIFEPYITSPNYYNSDLNPTINNATDIRQNSIYQDIDYSQGTLTPVNFDLLINGDATKATVQDSNYTLARHINPRYNGSRTTSQYLNVWLPGDTNTYGKLPTIESNKTYIAYSDTIEGYTPEKMNTSGVLVKYLISEDGELILNTTSENSLPIMKQNFIYGEKVELQTLSGGTIAQNPSLVIFRGGSSIEPILYNQIKHYENPPMTFASTLSFTDRNTYSTASVLDYTATLSPDNQYQVTSGGGFSGIFMNEVLSRGINITPGQAGQLPTGSLANRYVTISDVINENVDLVLEVNMRCVRLFPSIGTVYARIIRNRGGVITAVSDDFGGFISPSTNNPGYYINFTITIPRTELQEDDQYSVAMLAGQPNTFYTSDSTFKISTNPYPTPPIDVTNLWNTGSSIEPNIIYTTSSQLIQYANSSNIYQQDITGSEFSPIILPVTIQTGDEFRFEGDETKTFMVNNVQIYPSGSYLPNDPALVITLSSQISGSNININQFLLRRYVDNASSLILNGLKPSDFNSPYLIKPEYVSNKMKQNIGKYIEDFTSKGLL